MTNDAAAGVVERYLEALGKQDWDALARCLEPDVERIGPYNDVYRGREAYVAFLADTLRSLAGYELRVSRVTSAGAVVLAELGETVDTPQGRRRTEEAIVFDLSPAGAIARVAVYLRKSEVVAP
jgi:limonene-1,2-epoxide hydrolase